MTILTASQLGQSFGDVDLFGGVTVGVPPGARIGLVGPNGVGKTTLLMILAGLASPSRGRVDRARGVRVGYLPQEATEAFAGDGRSVYGEMSSVFEALRAEEAALRVLERAMAAGPADPDLVERYGRRAEAFEQAGGYTYELRIRQVLTGLGLGPDRWDAPVAQLSGGQKTRALLARLLLEQPDLLILDEPTNHLDVEAVVWLESTLAAWSGALVLVSHDRAFLDRVVDTVWEMASGGITVYRGNYSAYAVQRRERWARQRKTFDAMTARFEKELDFIRRNIAGQRTQMAQGRLARLAREVEAVHAGGLAALDAIQAKGWLQATAELDLKRAGDRVNDVARRVAELRPPAGPPPTSDLRLAPAARGGDIVLRTRDLVVGFPGRRLFAVDDVEVRRGDRVALLGGNGCGKTTFLRTVLGLHAPLAGEVRLGGGVRPGYLAQAQDALDSGATVLDTLLALGRHQPGEARAYLARFLFRDDDVHKRVGSLSGGERARLALALLALEEANLLLLDEPTNHLDIPSQEMLESVLADFPGTLIMVSHDRYLVNRLATAVWTVEDGRVAAFAGTYAELEASRRPAPAGNGTEPRGRGEAREASSGDDGRPALSKNERQRRLARQVEIEGAIASLEVELSDVADALQAASETGAFGEVDALGERHAALRAEIEALYAEWDSLTAELA